MNIYELNKEQLKKYEKEFYQTAYGKRMKSAKDTALGGMIFFLIIMISALFAKESEIVTVVSNGFLWLGVLIADIADALIAMKCNKEIKEYIKHKKTE